ncbi:MAG TPA: lasso peptide biosynthesis B2 protein [Pyrinomonadaceae bacterium]|nr:lasso peptide biosynthesis B2 protein [Pyrinomonadaceae bacterium]
MSKITRTTRLLWRATHMCVTRPDQAWLLMRMAWWVVVISVTARCYSLPRALAIVAGNNDRRSPEQASHEDLARAIDLLLSADVLIFKPICWKRAAVLHRYLSRTGTPTRIIFGVRNEVDGKFDGHAWLEADGQPIFENTPPNYVVTYSFP